MREVLQEPRDAQASFSSETTPTVWRTIPTLECLQERWEIMAKTTKFAQVQRAIQKGLEKLRKWHSAIGETDAYFICLGEFVSISFCDEPLIRQLTPVLDPSIKLEYCRAHWDDERVAAGTAALEGVVSSICVHN